MAEATYRQATVADALAERVERLRPHMEADPAHHALGRMSFSRTVGLLLQDAVEAAELRYGVTTPVTEEAA